MKYTRKYQTGGVTDPPFGSSHDPLGNFLGFNRNVNATIPAPVGKGNAPSPFGFSGQDGYVPFPMPSTKKGVVGEGTVRRRAKGPVTPTYALPDQRQQSLLPDYADPFEISHFGSPPSEGGTPESTKTPSGSAPPPGTPAGKSPSSKASVRTDIEMNTNLGNPNLGISPDTALADDLSVEGETASLPDSGEESGGTPWNDILQFGPDLLNFATGAFGKDKTRPATQVSNRAVSMIDDRINVNPQLQQVRSNYQAIINNPNATANQKLAAQAQMNNASNRIYADKFNKQQQLRANKASIQARLDSRQAGYDEQYRQDKMQSDANLGITGNFARQALGNLSTKVLQKKAMEAKETGDKRDMLAYISSLPEAVQMRLLEQYDLN